MENFLIYLIKASALLILFYVAYQALLKKETFFNTNRCYLLAGLITSTILPLVSYTKTIWVDPIPRQQVQVLDLEKVLSVQEIGVISPETISINWYDVAAGIYIAGALFLFIRFIFNFISLRKILKGQKAVKKNGFIFIDTQTIETPFSFFNYIVYNSSILNPEELESILCHEKVHSRQKHSADMIVCQLYCIFFWVNPFAWGYKKTISQNLEFIADSEAIKQLNSRAFYQKTLLKITVLPSYTTITNHFYQSLIKKRIVMLNKKQSRKRNKLKYILVLPALTVFILLFQVETIAKEKKFVPANAIKISQTVNDSVPQLVVMEINKNVSDAELTKSKAIFKKLFDADVSYKNIKRNRNNEIYAITVTVKDKDNKDSYPVYETILDNDKTIKTFTLEIEKEDNSNKNKILFKEIEKQNIEQTQKTAPSTSPKTAEEYIQNGNKGIKRLVIINGIKQKDGDINIPKGQRIHTMTELDSKSAIKKYGKEAKDGAVELTTIANNGTNTKVINNTFKEVFNSQNLQFSENVYDKSSNIKHITVTTTINETPEEFSTRMNTEIPEQVSNYIFVLMNNSDEKAIISTKSGLKKIGIDMKYSDITRNESGKITGIKIELLDTQNGKKSSAIWGASDNPDGIPHIHIGRRSGQLTVSGNN